MLDAIVARLHALPSVQPSELPRMADYATWGEAVHRGLGFGAESFVSTYNDNRKDAVTTELEDSPLGTVMLGIARNGLNLSCSAFELHTKLSKIVGHKTVKSGRWPKTINTFSSELRRMAPQLLIHGLSLEFSRNSDRRMITIKPVKSPGNPPTGGDPKT